MTASWFNRLFKSKSRPAARRRPARAQLCIEPLEAREVPAVFAFPAGGQLVVGTTTTTDTVSIDHAVIGGQPFTVVNESVIFADASITNGIHIQSGFAQLNILATAKPLTYDGAGFTTVVVGRVGNMQGITAPVSLGSQDSEVILDDSTDPTGQNVTMNTSGGTETVAGLARFATISFPTRDNLGDLQVKGGTGVNTFNLLNNNNFFTLDTGSGSDTANVLATSGGFLIIQGQAGFDTVNIGNNGSLQGIQSTVDVDAGPFIGGTKRVALFVDGSADTSPRNVGMGGAAATPGDFVIVGLISGDPFDIPFTDPIEYGAAHTSLVDVKGGKGGNTFTVNDTNPNGSTQVDTGSGGDHVVVQGTTGQLFLNSQGPATVNVGNSGSLLGIQGAIHITNPPSFDALILDGSADLVSRIFDLSATTTQGLIDGLGSVAKIFYNPGDVNSIHIIGGEGSEGYFVRSTAGAAPIRIDGLGSTVNFFVGNFNNSLDDIHNPLTLNGGAGFDRLFVHDEGAATGHFYGDDGSQITRDFGAVTINYSLMNEHELFRSPLPILFGPDPGFPQATDLALTDSIRAGHRATLTGQLVDANPDQVLSLTVVWGDGSAPVEMTPDRDPFRLTHRYEQPGTYKVLVIWTDSLGQQNFQDLMITVRPAHHGGHGDR